MAERNITPSRERRLAQITEVILHSSALRE
jgi:hypothetical protein